ncbi:MAG: glycosyltransferase family 4 protein [Phycisphaerae bacterium]
MLERFSRRFSVRRPVVASSMYYLGYAGSVTADLRANNCDFVLLFNFSQFVPMIRRWNPGIAIALNMQCEWLTQFDRGMVEQRVRAADWVIGCSAYIAGKVGRKFPGMADRCVPVFNGVDLRKFVCSCSRQSKKDDLGKRLLFVGRISPEKGLHVLLEAFRDVRQRYPDARLEIVGGDAPCPREYSVDLSDDAQVAALARFYNGRSYFSQLREQAVSAGVQDSVEFTGSVPHAKAVEHYQHADVLVNPSLSEAFGMSLVEGMASGLPVVATRVGGMTEIVEEGKTGLLVEPGDHRALAEALLTILDRPDCGRTMGKAGRERAAHLFSWDRIAEKILQLARRERVS